MRVKAVKGIQCPECNRFILKEDLDLMIKTLYRCGKCGTVYENRDEATKCGKD